MVGATGGATDEAQQVMLKQLGIDPGDRAYQQHIHSLQLCAGDSAAIDEADVADGAKYFLDSTDIVIGQYANVSGLQLL
jgi:hypothetical protein